MKRVYLSVPHMGGDEETFVREAFASNQLSSVGSQLDAFEHEMSSLVGLPSVALSSGTAAIHLGLRLLGVSPDDEVVTPTLTFVATVNPVRYLGAKPIFVDSERASWNQRQTRWLERRCFRLFFQRQQDHHHHRRWHADGSEAGLCG